MTMRSNWAPAVGRSKLQRPASLQPSGAVRLRQSARVVRVDAAAAGAGQQPRRQGPPPLAATAGGEGAGPAAEPSSNGVGPMHLGDDHLLPAHAGVDHVPLTHGGTANGNGNKHMPVSLYVNFPKLPPEGSTLTPEEAKCNPDVDRCRTPIHVWESRCSACGGTGNSRSYSSASHSRHRLISVCLLCHGLGYVRHSSTHVETVPYVNGSGPHTTIGRPPPPEHKARHWPLPGGLGGQPRRPPPRRP